MLSTNPATDSVLASHPDILISIQVYRPFPKKKVVCHIHVHDTFYFLLYLRGVAVMILIYWLNVPNFQERMHTVNTEIQYLLSYRGNTGEESMEHPTEHKQNECRSHILVLALDDVQRLPGCIRLQNDLFCVGMGYPRIESV